MEIFFFIDGGDFASISVELEQAFTRVSTQISGARVVNQRETEAADGDLPQWDLGITLPLSGQLEPSAIVGLISELRDLCRGFDIEMVAGLFLEDGAAEDVEYINGDTEPASFAEDFVRAIEG